jgi:NAD(P)-dependent dehydrogenase (short-subunit alcohol dehydrogenase family)
MSSQRSARRVLVTGASSGIGREAARRFAERGDRVALVARSSGRLEALAAELGDGALAVTADLGRREEAEAAVERVVDAFGGLDVLVSNAAATAYGPFDQIPPEDFRRTVEVSFLGAIDVIRAGLPHLERAGGTIVVTGSIVRDVPMPEFTPYIAAKSALRAFCDTLRAELAEAGSPVEVSVVEPGAVDTPFWKSVNSANGELPPVPFGAVAEKDVAKKILERTDDPQARSVAGALALAQRTAARALPSLFDRALPFMRKYLNAETTPARGEGSLWHPAERTAKERDLR